MPLEDDVHSSYWETAETKLNSLLVCCQWTFMLRALRTADFLAVKRFGVQLEHTHCTVY